jgi:hypothetical protein
MRSAQIARFFRVERRVNTAKDDVCTCRACGRADLVPPQRIARVNADSHDIAALYQRRIERFQRFIRENGRSIRCRRCRRKHVEPPRCNDPYTE